MSKKKGLRAVLTAALALVLSLGSFTTVHAEELPKANGTQTAPAEAAITKVLTLPEAADVPNVTFEFEFEAVSVDNVAAATAGNMPEIPTVEIEFEGTEDADGEAVDGVITVTKQSENIFAAFDDSNHASAAATVTFPHAGQYIYTVTETADTDEFSEDDDWLEHIEYSQASYTVRITVANTTDGQYGDLFIETITVETCLDAAGDEIEVTAKVDPAPGDTNSFTFINYYTVTNENTDPTDPDSWTLAVSGDVAGGLANKSQYFPYSVTVNALTLPGVTGTTYKAYVVTEGTEENTYAVVNGDTEIGTDDNTEGGDDYFNFESGTPRQLSLKPGQLLVFIGLPVGSTYTAVDVLSGAGSPYNTAPFNLYTASGTANGLEISGTPDLGQSLSTGSKPIVAGTGASASAAVFTNTREETPVTGVILNNLPYAGLILLALAGLALFAASKARKRVRSYE
jgi:hypothetical protein